MNRKLLNGLLVLAVAAGGVGTFTSCKDEDWMNDVHLEQQSLEAQIAAIRAVSDSEFKAALEEWLNNWTANIQGSAFDSYEDMVKCASDMYDLYNQILAGEITEDLEPFAEGLYQWLCKNYLDEKFQALTDRIDDLEELLEALKLSQQNRASSVEVSQTFNSMFGSVNLPIGLKTTVLASYVVQTSNEFDFPTQVGVNQLPKVISESPDLNKYLSALNTIQSVLKPTAHAVNNDDYTCVEGENYGNFGSAYLTVNPLSVDLTDGTYSFELVNSLGEAVLDEDCFEVMENDDLLSFGYTRADENTGIYKLNVNAQPGHFNGVTIDLKEDAVDFASSVKNFVKDKSISNLAYIGEELYKKLNGRIPAYGVKINWEGTEQSIVDGETVETPYTNSIMSNLDLAVAAIHPLSYGLDLEYGFNESGLSDKRLPVWSSLDDILAKIQNKLHIDFQEVEGVDYLEPFDLQVKIEKSEAGNGYVTFMWYNSVKGEYETVSFYFDPSGVIDNMSDEAIANLETFVNNILSAMGHELAGQFNMDVIDSINKSIDAINDSLKQYNAKVGDFTEYVKKHKLYNYADKLYEYYAKVAEKLNDFIANPNHYLQVMAIYTDMNGHYHHLSTNPAVPTVVELTGGDAIELLCSSYTGDIAVPSYLKYVAVTEVGGKAATVANNTAAGEYVNTVFPGQEHRVPVNVSSFKGQTVTLTYMSVDYSGVTSMQNYYIYVK